MWMFSQLYVGSTPLFIDIRCSPCSSFSHPRKSVKIVCVLFHNCQHLRILSFLITSLFFSDPCRLRRDLASLVCSQDTSRDLVVPPHQPFQVPSCPAFPISLHLISIICFWETISYNNSECIRIKQHPMESQICNLLTSVLWHWSVSVCSTLDQNDWAAQTSPVVL